jgi:four helix bundle suffix protein
MSSGRQGKDRLRYIAQSLTAQLSSQEKEFQAEGGFTERLYRVRQDERKNQMKRNFSRTIV